MIKRNREASEGLDLPVASLAATSPDYLERVYAGVLGKLIGVYVGRPVENWSYERIREEFGEINYYCHEQRGRLLIVTDDDISGTFTFLRALQDYDCSPAITARQIGQTWLNYLIENTTILWWGGMGNSTEHTAYLRLKQGIAAPESGSIALNSQTVAEQIGAQIFIDGWGMICPGDPERAIEFARKAASVSHDGEAVIGAQVIAAMVAEAFVESDVHRLIDRAVGLIPKSSLIYRLIEDLRQWHSSEGDWRENRARLEREYGYHKYHGQCHIIPNHGLILLSLLHSSGNFDEAMTIVNTAGWDTDCNSGNVGAILGVAGGLDGLAGKDWRGPVADRLYLPSADGGGAITDAARVAVDIANFGRTLAGALPIIPKEGRRFHFELSGSVQAWQSSTLKVENSGGALRLSGSGRAATPTFVPPEIKDLKSGYVLVASPTLYPGNTVRARLRAGGEDAHGCLYLSHFNAEDLSTSVEGPAFHLAAGSELEIEWLIEEVGGYPIHEIGLALEGGEVELLWMDWAGIPQTSFPPVEGTMWSRAWARGIDRFAPIRDRYDWLVQNDGAGVLSIGLREWKDYRVKARITPKMAVSSGIAVRFQGLRRYYAAVFGQPGELRIDKILDGRKVLATTTLPWKEYEDFDVEVVVRGNEISVWVNGQLKVSAIDADEPLTEGAIGFMVENGCMGAGTPEISPL